MYKSNTRLPSDSEKEDELKGKVFVSIYIFTLPIVVVFAVLSEIYFYVSI